MAQGCGDEAECVRHAGVPRGRAGHLRSVVGNDNAVEAAGVENGEDAKHVDVTVIDEGLTIAGDLAGDVAEMNVGDPALAGVGADGGIEIVFGHFSQGADAELEGIGGAGSEVDQTLVHAGLIDETGLTAEGGQRRVVGVGGEADA